MIDLNKISAGELTQLKMIASKASEKSELDKYYLFSTDPVEKVKMFIFCHRFMLNIHNLIDDGSLRDAIWETIEENANLYIEALELLEIEEGEVDYGKSEARIEIIRLIGQNKEIEDLIDMFSILTERVNVVQVSKLKGIILEGKSGEEYKRLFKKKEETEV